MKTLSLNGQWQLKFFEQDSIRGNDIKNLPSIPCSVPGNVELDLSEAGILPNDLYMGENIKEAEKYETYEWWYETSFPKPDISNCERVKLHFEGVDCFAEYYLNDSPIGTSANALIPHEFDITNKIIDNNILQVRIKSAMIAAYETEYETFVLKNAWQADPEAIYTRKPAHCYGWDIMPRAVSAGIWKDVELRLESRAEIKDIFYCVDHITDNSAVLKFIYDIDCSVYDIKKLKLKIIGQYKDKKFEKEICPGFKVGGTLIEIEDPALWWPYGYGESAIYDTIASLEYDGEVISEKKFNVGIRTLKLNRTEVTDGVDGKFEFIVNGEKIICKGSNWVPMDAYHSRDRQRYAKALELVRDIGCNILRLWGGNVYEQEEFYDFCDRNGIMIWQDFSMACHAYPQDDKFNKALQHEAKVIITALRNHTCIILWSGDNENDELLFANGTDPNDNRPTRRTILEMVRIYDGTRPYLPSSPYICSEVFDKHRRDIFPEAHLWGPRDYFKSAYYTKYSAHFVSEIGYHGCPCEESIRKFIEPEYVWPYQNNPQWILHSSDQHGNDSRVLLMERQIRQLFGTVPDNLPDYSLASQISQAEAKKFFIENVRCNRETKSGIIWWNLIDGWPQMSDAVVDYYYVKKLAYEYIKRSQQPFAIMMREIESWNSALVAANDTLTEKAGTYKLTRYDSNEVIAEGEFTVAPNSAETLCQVPLMYSDKALYIITWNVNGVEYRNHYLAGYPAFDFNKYKEYLKEILK